MSNKNAGGLDSSFSAAIKAAESSPGSEDAWAHVEELADQLQRPDDVGESYRKVLTSNSLTPDQRTVVAERAVRFHEEWFGDDPKVVDDLLGTIIDRDPDAEWAFERLTVRLTSNESWPELLGAYDRVLAVVADRVRRRQILEDAANVARDLAKAPDRAADYMQQRLFLEPDNTQLLSTLERLLERQERWGELVKLWRERIQTLSGSEALASRLRIASVALDQLQDRGTAVAELRAILVEAPGHSGACELLERVLADESADLQLRQDVLVQLRTSYVAADRLDDIVRVLGLAVSFVSESERARFTRELGSRLAILGRDDEATARYAELLVSDPADPDARRQLRQLAERSGRHDLHVQALLQAAEGAEAGFRNALWLDGAQIRRDRLGDLNGAIELLSKVLGEKEALRPTALAAAHQLNDLLASAGRDAERLAVVEQLAQLEPAAAVRRSLYGDVARLAERLEDPERALAAWTQRLSEDPQDIEALEALVQMLERLGRWEAMAGALAGRAEAPVLPQQRRADLVRLATVQDEHLDASADAVETWMNVRKEFGEDGETIEALDRLLSKLGDWERLADMLAAAAGAQRSRASRLLSRLGEIHGEHRNAPEIAVTFFARALAADPEDERAREGIGKLLENPTCMGVAVEALARAYEDTSDWQSALSLLETRLAAAEQHPDARPRQVSILRWAARVQESMAGDQAAAQRSMALALPLDPGDLAVEDELSRLTGLCNGQATQVEALRKAAEAASDSPARSAALYAKAGATLEQMEDFHEAAENYALAAQADPSRVDAISGVARNAARSGNWEATASSIVSAAVARERVDPDMLSHASDAIGDDQGAARELVTALETQLAHETRLAAAVSAALYIHAARWWSERVSDSQAGENAAKRAVELAPEDLRALTTLADVQRHNPSAALVETLVEIDRRTPGSLDAMAEATELAIKHSEPGRVGTLLDRLFARASSAWARGEALSGSRKPAELSLWALEKSVERHEAAGAGKRAAALLLEAARLPVEPTKATELRHRAAELLASAGEIGRAADILLSIAADPSAEVAVLHRAAEICEKAERISELVVLRGRELALASEVDERMKLRLELSKLGTKLEQRAGMIDSLLDNLKEVPAHRPSVESLIELLERRGRQAQLADILTDQATAVDASEPAWAANLWGRIAAIAENDLRDRARAVAAHERVVALDASAKSLDALARLTSELGDAKQTCKWLERRLEGSTPQEHVSLLFKLARARLEAGDRGPALESLEAAFAEAPKNAGVRKLLIKLHRDAQSWSDLARVLATAAEHVADSDAILAYAREAATLFNEKLAQPARAVPVLERALVLVPEDRDLRRMLARGLRAEGRPEEARTLLEALVADFGRRRSPARAEVHVELAAVLKDLGMGDEALDHLDEASKMDPGDLRSTLGLAELALEKGQVERAERAYRTLLISVRRTGGDERVGPAGVLLALSRIARERGDSAQADEQVESAIETIASGARESVALQRQLSERGEHALLRRVLQARLDGGLTGHRRAGVLAELAELLGGPLGDASGSFEATIAAVEADPADPEHHDRALTSGSEGERATRYEATISRLLEASRRDGDLAARVELQLRLARLNEQRGDLETATQLLLEAEATGARQVDVWRARARVAGALGDTAAQVELLERLTSLGEDQSETRTDALYRVAEVRLANRDTISEGLDALRRALGESPRWDRAARILQRATAQHSEDSELLDMFEQAVRRTDDRSLLLDALSRLCDREEVKLATLKEAADLATGLEKLDAAEAFMTRAVDIAGGSLEGVGQADWALLGLARRRLEQGDLAGAVKWVCEAAEVSGLDAVLGLAHRIDEMTSGPEGDLTLPARVYERVLARDANVRGAWEPLAGIYRRLGDVDKLERLVDETLDSLEAAEDRNALRLELTRLHVSSRGGVERAIAILRDALLELPGDEAAQDLLESCLERSGDEAQLIELARTRMMVAQGNDDKTAVKRAALALIRRLENHDPSEIPMVLRGVLENAPEDVELIDALLLRLVDDDDAAERIVLRERRLTGSTGTAAADLALALADEFSAQDDQESALRVLNVGAARSAGDKRIRDRLMNAYRERGDFAGLSAALVASAHEQTEVGSKIELLREAATLQRDTLFSPDSAADILTQAVALMPENFDLRVDLALALDAAGQIGPATEVLAGGLVLLDEQDARRVPLLRTRADLLRSAGDLVGHLADLEAAYVLDPAAAGEDLERAVEHQRAVAEAAGEVAVERAPTMRLVDLAVARGDTERATSLLEAWTDRSRKDIEALTRLWTLDLGLQRLESILKVCGRLVALTADASQVEAALGLWQAAASVGRPDDARKGLEYARRKQPEDRRLVDALAELYEATGARRELAGIWLELAEGTEGDERIAVLRRVASVYLEAGDPASAMPVLDELLRLAPDDAHTRVLLVDAYIASDKLEEANALLDAAITEHRGRRSPELAALQHRKARVAQANADRAGQLEWLTQAHTSDKNNAWVTVELADLAEQMEEWDVALKVLRGLSLDGGAEELMSRAEAFFRQARIALRREDRQRARLWARRALQEDAAFAPARTFLDEMGEG